MIKTRIMLVAALAGLVLAGCQSLAGSACLKPLADEDVQDRPPLRVPVGLDSVDKASTLVVPPLEQTAAVPVTGRCLEDPPKVEALVSPASSEKELKKQIKEADKEARRAEKAEQEDLKARKKKGSKKEPDSK